MRLTQKDFKIANRIIHHPDVYPMITDDYVDPSNNQTGLMFLQQPTIWVLHPNEHMLLILIPRTSTVFELHTMVEPEGRGKQALVDIRRAAHYLFNNTTCEKVVTYVPFYNRAARLFALKGGMKDEGICTKSIRKNGELHDQWVLGLEREAFSCQPQ